MAIARRVSNISVVEAAERRIINVFNNGLPVYMSFSGGKDSLCISQLTLNLIRQGRIDPSQLTVQFIDEEAIFPCIEETVLKWRKKFMLSGAKFEWFCVEVKHFNCFNALSNDETFICWDSEKEDVWVRRPPPFAIRTSPLLKPRKDSYQDWLPKLCMDGITIVGVRTAESIQRLQYIASMNYAKSRITKRLQIFPIYDWTNNDVWLYLLNENVDIPNIYLYLWQSGTSKGQLRVSQFFSIDTACSLVKMNEYYPNLMERVIKRENNAYLASLYWDTEMFGRSTKKRKRLEEGIKINHKEKLLEMFNNMDLYFDTKHKKYVAQKYKNFFLQISAISTESDYKYIYEGLIKGDPKLRSFRALYQKVFGRYITSSKKNKKEGALKL